jgi:hypothetical protein
MSITFAGSRCVDERRRRRLAQEAEQETPAERRAPSRAKAVLRRQVVHIRAPESPLEDFLRPQLWLNVLLAVVGLSLCGGIVWLGDWIDQLHPELAASFGLRDGLLARLFRCLTFLAGAQLAYAILWYRARSKKDFAGRYRVWHFVVPAWLVFGLATATDGHWLAAQWVRNEWSLSGSNAVSLCWMVPAGIVLLTLTRLLHAEMRGSRGSAACMWLATIAAAMNAFLLLGAGTLPVDERIAYLMERTAECLWPLAVLMAMVFYARHVIYVTNEPAPRPQGDSAPGNAEIELNWFERWRERRREAAELRRATARQQAAERQEAALQRKAEAEALRMEKAAKKAAARADAAPMSRGSGHSEDEDESPPGKTPAVTVPTSPRPEARTVMAPSKSPATAKPAPSVLEPDEDEPEDDDDSSSSLHGLSRKERRRLRKLQRQKAGQF